MAGRLTLLDCAGSEWSADNAHHDAKRRAEGAEINASLHACAAPPRAPPRAAPPAPRRRATLCQPAGPCAGGSLKQCIRLHAERQREAARGGPKVHVPFRESILTRLLAESFEASDARLAVLGCVAPAATDVEHSVGTMRAVMQIANAAGAEETSTQQVARLKSSLK